jgi:PIN domain nuclease of toxin-antitoxin system
MILVDTQIVIWLALEPDKVSRRASEAILEARWVDQVAISDKTLWELWPWPSRKGVSETICLCESC